MRRKDRREHRKNTYITILLLAIIGYMGTKIIFELPNIDKRTMEYKRSSK